MSFMDKVTIEKDTVTNNTSTAINNTSHRKNTDYGWICPVCGRGNAPWNSSCSCRGGYWTYPTPWWRQTYYTTCSNITDTKEYTFAVDTVNDIQTSKVEH